MAFVSFIRRLRYNDRRLQLSRPQVYDPCPYVEIMDRNSSHPIRSGELNDRIPGMERRRRIRRSHTVAGIPADRSDIADLRPAYHIDRLSKHIDMLLDDRIPRYM